MKLCRQRVSGSYRRNNQTRFTTLPSSQRNVQVAFLSGKEFRLGKRHECCENIQYRKISALFQEATDLAVSRARESYFSRYPSISMDELLNNLPSLVEDFHK